MEETEDSLFKGYSSLQKLEDVKEGNKASPEKGHRAVAKFFSSIKSILEYRLTDKLFGEWTRDAKKIREALRYFVSDERLRTYYDGGLLRLVGNSMKESPATKYLAFVLEEAKRRQIRRPITEIELVGNLQLFPLMIESGNFKYVGGKEAGEFDDGCFRQLWTNTNKRGLDILPFGLAFSLGYRIVDVMYSPSVDLKGLQTKAYFFTMYGLDKRTMQLTQITSHERVWRNDDRSGDKPSSLTRVNAYRIDCGLREYLGRLIDTRNITAPMSGGLPGVSKTS